MHCLLDSYILEEDRVRSGRLSSAVMWTPDHVSLLCVLGAKFISGDNWPSSEQEARSSSICGVTGAQAGFLGSAGNFSKLMVMQSHTKQASRFFYFKSLCLGSVVHEYFTTRAKL